MILKGAVAGFRVVEVPVSHHPRIGKSKVSGTLKGTVGAANLPLDRYITIVEGSGKWEECLNCET